MKLRNLLINGIVFSLPDTIELIKSTCMEEGGAIGYTRKNFIVLAENFLYEDVLVHELYHIFSRYNHEKREALYNILGFKKCNEIPYPETIKDRRMTNPDAPDNDYYIRVKIKDDSLDVFFAIYAKSDYNGGGFFSYLTKRLVLLSGDDGNKRPAIRNGRPVLLRYNIVIGLYEQIGKNTEYNIHPEEICADHFVQLLSQSDRKEKDKLIKRMGEVLKE